MLVLDPGISSLLPELRNSGGENKRSSLEFSPVVQRDRSLLAEFLDE